MALTPEQERLWIQELGNMGRERVRASLDHNTISPAYVSLSWDWLSKEETDEKRRREASNSEQIEIARSASEVALRAASAAERQATAAERANTRATIALTIAILSMIVSVIAIWLPHYWDLHK
jgi:hypothetical protein